jgi:pimeloyl-ACP methyl ester carboxylesterase
MNETTSAEQWATQLPPTTLLIYDPDTVLPIREIAAILRQSCPTWTFREVPGAGHMAPLTRPNLINPLVSSFLSA